MRTAERARPLRHPIDLAVPTLLVMIRPGTIRVVHVARTDQEGAVCADLAEDLRDQLSDLRGAVARLNR